MRNAAPLSHGAACFTPAGWCSHLASVDLIQVPGPAAGRGENRTTRTSSQKRPDVARLEFLAQLQEQQSSRYVQVTGSQGSVDQLAKLADLRDRGVITADEFDREKAKILV